MKFRTKHALKKQCEEQEDVIRHLQTRIKDLEADLSIEILLSNNLRRENAKLKRTISNAKELMAKVSIGEVR